MKTRVYTVLSIALLLLAWQMIAWQIDKPELIPGIPRLAGSIVRLLGTEEFYYSIGITCLRTLSGLVLSLLSAMVVAWLMARHAWVSALFRPWLGLMRSIPVISFILIALIFIHPEGIPLLIAFLTMFPLLTENLSQAFQHFRPGYNQMARLFHLSGYNRLTQIYYPQIKPYFFSGLSSAMGFGWRAIIMGEVLAQCTAGIGGAMKRAQLFIDIPQLLAWTGVAILLSWLSDRLIQHLAAWQPAIRFPKKESGVQQETRLRLPVRLEGIGYHFGVRPISFELLPNQTYALVAPSGKGKTTCLRLIDGTYRPTQGTLRNCPNRISVVFQEPELLPHLSTLDNVTLPLASLFPEKEARQIATALLQSLEMKAFASHLPSALSYGQQQRAALARALAFPAPLLLMDEPFRGLDAELCQRIIERMKEWQRNGGQTILFTTHQESEIKRMGAQVLPL